MVHSRLPTEESGVVFDCIAAALGSFSEYCGGPSEAKELLLIHVASLGRRYEELSVSESSNYRPFALSKKLIVLLTESTLREGYLRPILSIALICLGALGAADQTACKSTLKTFTTLLLTEANISSVYFSEVLGQIAKAYSDFEFEGDGLRQIYSNIYDDIRKFSDNIPPISAFENSKSSARHSPGAPVVGEVSSRTLGLEDRVTEKLSELKKMVGLDAVKAEVVGRAPYQ
jgi:hypothetical protein